MRIGLLTQSCDTRTGIGRIALNLAHRFSDAGNDVHVLAQHIEGLRSSVGSHRLLRLPFRESLNKVILRSASRTAIRGLKCDVVHTFGVGRGAQIVSAQSCHLAGMELLRGHRQRMLWRRSLGFYDRVSLADEKALLTSATTRAIVAVSGLVRDQIHEFYHVPKDRIEVVPNGVDFERLRVARTHDGTSAYRRRLQIEENQFVLLFVGNEFDRKGLQPLIEGLARLHRRDWILLVAGSDDPSPFELLAVRRGLSPQVRFLGAVDNVESLFGIADLFVFPSLYEPFGMVIVEAMAAGVPVITSGRCGAVEGMKGGTHGLYLQQPDSPEEIGSTVQMLLDNPALREELATNARNKAQEFDWGVVAKRFLDVYADVVA